MKLQDMHLQIKGELAHIPDWPEPQRELRMLYQVKQMRNFGSKTEHQKTRSEILAESIQQLRAYHPTYKFEYDPDFFESTGMELRLLKYTG